MWTARILAGHGTKAVRVAIVDPKTPVDSGSVTGWLDAAGGPPPVATMTLAYFPWPQMAKTEVAGNGLPLAKVAADTLQAGGLGLKHQIGVEVGDENKCALKKNR